MQRQTLKMYLGIIIIYCLHLTVNAESGKTGTPDKTVDAAVDGQCSLVVLKDRRKKMPIVFKNTAILYPDESGRLNVNVGDEFSLSCTGSNFNDSDLEEKNEVTVSCAENNLLRFNGTDYKYKHFECQATPKSVLVETKEKCQQGQYTVVSVGFRTSKSFLVMYKVCFDKNTKHSLYAWHRVRTPYYNSYEITDKRPFFKLSRLLYGDISMNNTYKKENQIIAAENILKSDSQAAKYVKKDGSHFLARGHYSTMTDFYYIYQQNATFNYANTTPQWQCFNNREWSKVEEAIRNRMAEKSATRHLIVTGSFRWCELPDKDGVRRRLFLLPPSSVPVPLFVWKLLYDVDTDTGTVYLGLNNPYAELDDDDVKPPCPNTCEGQYSVGKKLKENENNAGLIYCCTMESFFDDRVYGKLDPIVFSDEQ